MEPLIDPFPHPTATRIVLDESQSAELARVVESSPSRSVFALVARDSYPGATSRFVIYVVPCTLTQAQAMERQILHPEETGKGASKPPL